MRKNNRSGNLKVLVLTQKDRKLLEGIHKSLEDLKKGKIKPFIEKEILKKI